MRRHPLIPWITLSIAFALVLFLASAPAFGQANRFDPSIYDLMIENPVEAEKSLRNDTSPQNKMALATFLFFESGTRDDHIEEVTALLHSSYDELKEKNRLNYYYARAVTNPSPFDGTVDGFNQYAQLTGLATTCRFLKRHRDLHGGVGFAEITGHYRWRPSYLCGEGTFPELKSVFNFIEKMDKITWYPRGSCRTGSIIRDYAGGLNIAFDDLLFAPERRQSWFRSKDLSFRDLWYKEWSLYGRWNRTYWESLVSLFETATKDLSHYYQDQLNIDANESALLASGALMRRMFNLGPAGYNELKPDPLVSAILQDKSVEEITRILDQGWSEEHLTQSKALYIGQSDHPLHAAITRPDIVELLLDSGLEPSATNSFGKTALMAAAHHNDLESARILLDAGAEINARILHPGEIIASQEKRLPGHCQNTITIRHGWRTALMYAAENASLDLVKLLLKASNA